MTNDERRSLARQITDNPLYGEIIAAMEREAVETLIHAKPEALLSAQMDVAAVRMFAAKLKAALAEERPRVGLS